LRASAATCREKVGGSSFLRASRKVVSMLKNLL
jgi:hypothetical protein